MGQFFSDKTEEGIRLVWMQFDSEQIAAGRQLLKEATEEGDPDAPCFLARVLLSEGDRDGAFALLRKSAGLGSSCGILTMLQFGALAKEVLQKFDSEQRRRAAVDVQKKAEGGHAYCQLIMGMFYFWGGYWVSNGRDIEKEYGDEDKALEARLEGAAPWLEKALSGGVTDALVNLYDIYEASPGNEEKLEKAMRFAAERGDPYWQIRLPNWLFEQERYEEALAGYRWLAQEGYPRAWYDIAFQYQNGLGVERDPAKAADAYRQGAELGSNTCQTRLGKLLLSGKAVPKDEAQAYFWFCQAAQQQDEVAKMWKGHCLQYGLGVQKNQDEGLGLLFDALNFNFPDEGEAQTMSSESPFDWKEDMMQLFWDLGDGYENGLGLPQRDHQAGYYYSMVAHGGWPQAIEKMTHYKEAGLFNKKWKRIN